MRSHRHTVVLAALVALLAVVTGCGGDDESDLYWSLVIPTREEAGEALDRAVELAQAGDFEALCEETATAPELCEGMVPPEAEAVPDEWPEVKCHLPRQAIGHNGQLNPAGRILVLEGRDANGEPYRSEMSAQYHHDGEDVRLMMPLWWTSMGVNRGDGSTEPPDPPDWCDHEGASTW
jgi:hypothetical protein